MSKLWNRNDNNQNTIPPLPRIALTLLDLFHKKTKALEKRRKHSAGETMRFCNIFNSSLNTKLRSATSAKNLKSLSSTLSELRSQDIKCHVCLFIYLCVLPPSAPPVVLIWGPLVTESAASSPHPAPALSVTKTRLRQQRRNIRNAWSARGKCHGMEGKTCRWLPHRVQICGQFLYRRFQVVNSF